jgi:hypothetical protein
LLAPTIQEDILALPRGCEARSVPTESEIRSLSGMTLWRDQQRVWVGFRARLPRCSSLRHHQDHGGVPQRGRFRAPRRRDVIGSPS